MKKLSVFLLLFTLTACAPIPWHVKETKSSLLDATEVSVGPVWTYSTTISLSLYRRTNMPEGRIILIAHVPGIRLFSKEPSLLFQIDGAVVTFSSTDERIRVNTDPGSVSGNFFGLSISSSSKHYEIDDVFLKRLINAEKVIVQIKLKDSLEEGVFSDDRAEAHQAFSNFYERISGQSFLLRRKAQKGNPRRRASDRIVVP
ncbi:MAG: hypothetical protein ABGX83_02690 [Nitrospira sp.]|nr:hypothetical protein [Candidatus Manganitrophaceae bacterium]HIL34873.1 hypothetical protein [Candidatus Manganitrophaceae bacterium]